MPRKHSISTGTKTKVQQNFKDDTNVNKIVQRFSQTGELPMGQQSAPLYLDHTQYGDFTEMLNKVTHVKQAFDKLPAKIRAQFENQPAQMLQFVQNPLNNEEAIKMGLINNVIKPDTERSGYPKPTSEEKPTSTPEEPTPAPIKGED